MKKRITLATLIIVIAISNTAAQDWNQYLGPDRNSISEQTGILRSWPENSPEVLWTTGVGIGFGGPVVKEGKVYLLDRDDSTGDKLRCFDLTSGKELWHFAYEAPGSVSFPGSRSVPTLDGNRIYSCGPYGDLYCIDINSHKPLWNKNIWKDFGGEAIPRWAITQCPLVFGDLLIVASQAPEAGLVAYDKMSGSIKWKTPPVGPVGYVSPIMVMVGGEKHVVMISAASGRGEDITASTVAGFDPGTGRKLWEYTDWKCVIPVPNVIDAGNGRMLITGAYEAGSAMIKVDKNGDGTYTVSELYKNLEFGAHTQPPVLYDGHFYAQYSTNERKDGLTCMSIDGEVKWKTRRSPSFDKGGIIVADGLLLITDGSSRLYLVEPDPSAFNPIVSSELLKEEQAGSSTGSAGQGITISNQNWAPLALYDGMLIIRDQNRLMCVKVAR